MTRIKGRIAVAKNTETAVHKGEKTCVSRYLDVCIIRHYRRHNTISGVKTLQFASE